MIIDETELERIVEDASKSMGQRAGDLPVAYRCFTEAELQRIVSSIILKIKPME